MPAISWHSKSELLDKQQALGLGGSAADHAMDEGFITRYVRWLNDSELLCQMYVFYVNHRLQETQDPLTHTLVIMSTMPIQLVFCESGILPFRTPNLPVYPFTDMTQQQRMDIAARLAEVPSKKVIESVEGCGKISVAVPMGSRVFVDKVLLVRTFVNAVTERAQLPQDHDNRLSRRFCKIIFQRFVSSVTLLPCQVNEILGFIDGTNA